MASKQIRDFSKYEKVQTRRHGNSKKANRVLEEFKKMTESQVVLAELEAKSAVTNMYSLLPIFGFSRALMSGYNRQRKQKKFTATFAGTFNAIMTDGLDCPENETRNTHGLKTKLDSTKSGCHQVVAEYEDGLQKFSSCHNLLSFHAFQSKSAAELTDAKAILETGRMVGEDKIRAILTGSSISPEDPNQIKASDALFAAKDQDAESLSWAVAAREQGKIMKKLTAAISRMMD